MVRETKLKGWKKMSYSIVQRMLREAHKSPSQFSSSKFSFLLDECIKRKEKEQNKK